MIVIVLFLFNLPYVAISADFIQSTGAKRRTYLDNKNIPTRLLWIFDDYSAARCLMDCAKDDRCCSIFYNKITDKCQGHSITFGSTAGAVDDPGSMYYVLHHGERYIGDTCVTASDCVTINSECRDDTCLCVPGYSFFPRTQKCQPASVCQTFGSGFQKVWGYYINKQNKQKIPSVSLETCFALCINRTSYTCRSLEYLQFEQRCNLAEVTKLTQETKWQSSSDPDIISYFQRDCALPLN